MNPPPREHRDQSKLCVQIHGPVERTHENPFPRNHRHQISSALLLYFFVRKLVTAPRTQAKSRICILFPSSRSKISDPPSTTTTTISIKHLYTSLYFILKKTVTELWHLQQNPINCNGNCNKAHMVWDSIKQILYLKSATAIERIQSTKPKVCHGNGS